MWTYKWELYTAVESSKASLMEASKYAQYLQKKDAEGWVLVSMHEVTCADGVLFNVQFRKWFEE